MENGACSAGGVNGSSFSDKEAAPGGGNGTFGVGSYGLGEVRRGATDSFRPESSVPPFSGGGAGGGAVVVRISHPFHCANNSSLPFKSPGMSTALGFPFTWTQWKELERQAMVYKYMMASVPVPPDLLLPIPTNTYPAGHTTSTPHFRAQCGSDSGVGYTGKNRDLEPGRCKRTDGKKWRCSKEVAPNQKYCERHLHRGRPRSRKPVEDQNSKKIPRLQLQSPPLESLPMGMSHSATPPPASSSKLLGSSKEPQRSFDWMMQGEMVAMGGAEEQWQQFIYRDNAPIFQQMNMFDENQIGIREDNLYFNPEFGMMDVSPSSFAGDILDSQRAPVSWAPFESGGPLAEVLKPTHHHHALSGDSISPAGTAVSSPSGVLQKATPFSQSDGSVCNSPTLAAEMVPFQWLT